MASHRRLTRLSLALASALSGTSAVTIATATSAFAQATEGLDEVTVTAQRREENQQDVPISITTLPEDRFTAILQGADDIRALATRVPGLYAESSNGRIAPRFYIRGLGNTDFDLAASQPVSIIMDEIVMENVVLKSFPLFDIERVEVLRGPQGTLFGRNTPAGIVKFDTVKPGEEQEGYISGSFGRFATTKVEGALGGPLTDTLSYRASVLYQRRSDWVDNGGVIQNGFASQNNAFGGFSDIAGRFQVAWAPTENFDALFNIHGRKLEGTSELFRANILGPGNNELNPNFDRDVVFYDEGGGNNQNYDNFGGSARLSLDLGAVTVTSISAFETASGDSRGDIDGGSGASFLPNGSFPGFIPFNSDTQDKIDGLDQFTQEIRLASDYEGPLNWQAGFFYFDSDLTITTNPFFAPATTVRHDNQSWALFAQGSYDLTERLTFTGGVRYTDDNKDFIGVATNFPVAPVSVSDEKVTWDAALTFAATDAVNLYARVARGFRAPTIQGRDVAFFGSPTTATSETVLSYEAGVKSTLFNNRMRVNASGWYYDANDLQFSAIGGLGNFNQLVNADGEAWGFEADLEWLVTENFLMTGGVGYANTEITEPGLAVAACGGGCTVTDPIDGLGNALITGNPFPQAPDWTWNVTARYSVPTAKGEFYLFTDWAGQGETNFFLYESAEFNNDGSVEGGARLGMLCKDGKLDVALYVRNILDAEIVRGGIDFNNLTGFVNEPRIYGISASLKF
ncbi:MAG: TonB-dependent receptor [Parvularculaceae bacterium]|nr:TonB-dependent receptor [Parvularculaceae bacterium]